MELHRPLAQQHLILDSTSLKSYHAVGRKHHAIDYIALILRELTERVISGGKV
jgi:hypothetical protein